MTNLKLFAFLSGLNFALQQFGYLLWVQLNISSTYVSYMLVTTSWLTGIMIGLWTRKLSAYRGLLLGLLAYYSIYAVIVYYPLSVWTLWATAAGVALTGLWAGRFFVVIQGLIGGTDQLFLHENNGFVVGLAIFFIGFTLAGRQFILWMPLILTAVLMLSLRAISSAQRYTTKATTSKAESSTPML